MAQPVTQMEVAMAQPNKPPLGGIKRKALFDNNNAMTSKILFCNSHTPELMPWIGFIRQPGKDFTFTSIPFTSEKQRTVMKSVEAQVTKILGHNQWSKEFSLTPTEVIYAKTTGCRFCEKREDGSLYPTKPDVEGELHNSPEKSLRVGALLQVTGVFFDFATKRAKLTYKLVSAAYSWTQNQATSHVVSSYLSLFGPIVSDEQPQHQQQQQQQHPPTNATGTGILLDVSCQQQQTPQPERKDQHPNTNA